MKLGAEGIVLMRTAGSIQDRETDSAGADVQVRIDDLWLIGVPVISDNLAAVLVQNAV